MNESLPNDREPVVLAGIDEAGYGPLLGPLVVSAVAVRLPRAAAEGDLWDLLRGTVARHKPSVRKREPRLVIDDSKKVYKARKGLDVLERSALGALHAFGAAPRDFDGLLAAVCPASPPDRFAPYPWYRDRDIPVPHMADAADLQLAGKAIKRELAGLGGRLLGVCSEFLLAGEFNHRLARNANKAALLFELNTRLLARLMRLAGRLPLRVVADKHGGRDYYRADLMRAFPQAAMTVLAESSDRSDYRLESGKSSWEISFAKEAESKHLPVALASMVSKYLRERFMEQENRYWQAKLPNLAWTAGYYEDGQRFLRDIASIIDCPLDLLRRNA